MRPPARRWLIVAALFLINYGVSTPLAAYGVFLAVLTETFGWSRGAVAAAVSTNLLLGGLAGLGIGAFADRHGPRVPLVLTVALAGTAFALVGAVSALWQLYLFVGVLGGIGMSSFYLLSASTVSHWFAERRGLAIGVVLVGFNLGYITGGPLAAWLIEHLGWRAAYGWLGGGSALLTLGAAITVRLPRTAEATALGASGPAARGARHARVTGAGVTLREALSDPRQWYLNASWLLLGGLAMMISVHIVPFARDQGISLADASLALTAYGLGAVTGRLTSGAISDRIGTKATIHASYLLQALALSALLWAPTRETLLAVLAVFGAGFAAADTMVTKAIPDIFGLRAIGAILGVLTLGWRCGSSLAPAVAGFLYDWTGTYRLPFGAAPLAVLVSWSLYALATARRR